MREEEEEEKGGGGEGRAGGGRICWRSMAARKAVCSEKGRKELRDPLYWHPRGLLCGLWLWAVGYGREEEKQ